MYDDWCTNARGKGVVLVMCAEDFMLKGGSIIVSLFQELDL